MELYNLFLKNEELKVLFNHNDNSNALKVPVPKILIDKYSLLSDVSIMYAEESILEARKNLQEIVDYECERINKYYDKIFECKERGICDKDDFIDTVLRELGLREKDNEIVEDKQADGFAVLFQCYDIFNGKLNKKPLYKINTENYKQNIDLTAYNTDIPCCFSIFIHQQLNFSKSCIVSMDFYNMNNEKYNQFFPKLRANAFIPNNDDLNSFIDTVFMRETARIYVNKLIKRLKDLKN
jgi:hypothetical protein